MKRRLLLISLVAVALSLSAGCAVFMPNTAKVIEPNGFDELFLAVAADLEALWNMINEHGWMGLFFL
jgi:hypothetical protein